MAMTNEGVSPWGRSDALFYLMGAVAGVGTGWVDVTVNDLLFTALLVLMACMLLGLLRPRWPWRWVVVVAIFIPLTELVAYWIMTVKTYARPGVWIVPDRLAGNSGCLWRCSDAAGD